jgi:acetolactate synthase-1/2/3 large subunit
MNEIDVAAVMAPVTKYAVTVTDPAMVQFHLDKAIHVATTGRQGPVFLDIPIDVQGAELPEQQCAFVPDDRGPGSYDYICGEVLKLLRDARRPVLIVGNGVRLAGAVDELRTLIARFQFPVVASWTGADMVDDLPWTVGRCGIFGTRAGNLAVQNADLIIAIGTRLSFPQTGHAPQLFAPDAKRIIVDVDANEASKKHLRADLAIEADAKAFLSDLLEQTTNLSFLTAHRSEWIERCKSWRPIATATPG